jgi:DNA-binding NarL/FixJ family response regulator
MESTMTGESTTTNTWASLLAPAAVPATRMATKARVVRRLTRQAERHQPKQEPRAGRRTDEGEALHVLLVAQPGLFSEMLAQSLQALARTVRVCQSSAEDAVSRAWQGGLVLIDLDCAGSEPERLIGRLRSCLTAPLVVLAANEDAAVMGRMLAAGAAAFLAKTEPTAQVLDVLRTVIARNAGGADRATRAQVEQTECKAAADEPAEGKGRPYGLTSAQLGVLALLAEGLSNQSIAKRRGICEGTVKIHLNAIYQKLGVQSRTQAARIAQRLDAVRDLQIERASDGRDLLDWLLPYVTSEARAPGELLFKRGDPGDALYFVQEGRVRLSEIETEVADGELLGEVGVFAPGHRRTCTARCAAETRLFRLSADRVKQLYFENPEFAFHLMRLVAQRLTVDRDRPRIG